MTDFEQQLKDKEAAALLAVAPCGDGTLPFRTWQPWGDQMGGELLVLLHGGSGSWNHWLRNIDALSDYYELVIPDLPGLGDAARAPKDSGPYEVAAIVASGIQAVVGPRRFHLVGFSWGAAVASLTAATLGEQVKSLALIGAASVGKLPEPRQMLKLMSRKADMSYEQIAGINRENLARLMIHDRAKIDPLAVYLQNINTARARFNSPKFAGQEYVLEGLQQSSAPVLMLYGEKDRVALPNLNAIEAKIHAIRPDATFEVREGVGHWLQYEDADWFNTRLVNWIETNIFV